MDFKTIHKDFIQTLKNYNIYSTNKKNKIYLNGKEIFEKDFQMIAGPCSIENYEQLYKTASFIKQQGTKYLRAGTYKLRTNYKSFQGLGLQALEYLYKVGKDLDLITVSEIPSIDKLDEFIKYTDIIVVGMRNMRNYELLKKLATTNKPIILKRGDSSTILEWIEAALYIYDNGNKNVILCERGIKSFEPTTRNTLDLAGALLVSKYTVFPVIIDPSHGIGISELVPEFVKVSKTLNFKGSIIEVTPDPKNALSDGYQSLNLEEYEKLIKEL